MDELAGRAGTHLGPLPFRVPQFPCFRGRFRGCWPLRVRRRGAFTCRGLLRWQGHGDTHLATAPLSSWALGGASTRFSRSLWRSSMWVTWRSRRAGSWWVVSEHRGWGWWGTHLVSFLFGRPPKCQRTTRKGFRGGNTHRAFFAGNLLGVSSAFEGPRLRTFEGAGAAFLIWRLGAIVWVRCGARSERCGGGKQEADVAADGPSSPD